MAKGYKGNFVKQAESLDAKRFKVITTIDGTTLKLSAVPQLLMDKVMGSIPDPVRPTYEMEIIGGEKQYDILTDDVIKDTENIDAALAKKYRKQLDKYFVDLVEAEMARNRKMTETVLLTGVHAEVPKADEPGGEWIENVEFLGLEIPTALGPRKVFYLESVVLKGKEDIDAIMDGVMELSGLSEAQRSEARASFRDNVQEGTPENVSGENTPAA